MYVVLLYLHVRTVGWLVQAPRAKMNQQRSRRFRASKESREKRESIRQVREELVERGTHSLFSMHSSTYCTLYGNVMAGRGQTHFQCLVLQNICEAAAKWSTALVASKCKWRLGTVLQHHQTLQYVRTQVSNDFAMCCTFVGVELPPEKPAHFDSNCITPGTEFMHYLAKCLRFYVHDRMNNNVAWQNIKVVLSDANVPGEGEHKIMDYIRRQRGRSCRQVEYHPKQVSCQCIFKPKGVMNYCTSEGRRSRCREYVLQQFQGEGSLGMIL